MVYAFLILIAGVTGYLLWKKGNFRLTGTGASRLKVLESRLVGPKQCLMVVDYEGQKLLLGVSPGNIQNLALLTDFSEAEAFEPLLAQHETKRF
jgi:flagellar biogenesis protein FliO